MSEKRRLTSQSWRQDRSTPWSCRCVGHYTIDERRFCFQMSAEGGGRWCGTHESTGSAQADATGSRERSYGSEACPQQPRLKLNTRPEEVHKSGDLMLE